ncbi:TPA: ankyrin repeat domain-containing protein, partial [Candidatus Micrarchaeota archaeon]|nr:ankyrin repeat domain-containing protein [Candidatus Micrarchaeota archaeon]
MVEEKVQKEFYGKIEAFDAEGVMAMLSHTPELVNARLSYDGRSPLIHAVMNAMEYGRTTGHLQIEILKVLLEAGANPNALTSDGRNALGWAAGFAGSASVEVDQYDAGRVVQVIMEPRTHEVFKEIVTLLLTAGADPDLTAVDRSDRQTKTMVEFARPNGVIRDGKTISYLHGECPKVIMLRLIEEHGKSKTSNPLAKDGVFQAAQAFSDRPAQP